MKKSKDTFELIHSLSKSEKRYIKLSISVHKGEQDHIKLFDVLESLKEYDETKIRELLKGEKLLGRLHVVKNYLYHQILKSLRSYHNSISMSIEVNSILHSISILHRKGLATHAQKMVDKAKKICEQHELFSQLLELNEWEIRLLTFNKEKFAQTDMPKILKNQKNILENFVDDYNSRILMHQVHQISNKTERGNFLKNKKVLHDLPEIESLTKDHEPKTFRGKTSYYQAKIQYYGMIGKPEGQYKFSKKLVILFSENPDKIMQATEKYISGLQNYYTICNILKKYDEAFYAIKKLKEIKIENVSQQRYLYIITLVSELSLHRALGNTKEGIAVFQKEAKTIENNLIHEAKYLSYVYGNISLLYFMDQKYKEALKYINICMKGADVKQDENAWLTTKITYLMIHFELENYDLLTSKIRSEKIYLKKNVVPHTDFYSLILNFFNGLVSETSATKQQKRCEKFADELKKAIKSNPQIGNSALLCEHLMIWIESKIKKTGYLEYMIKNPR